MYEKPGHRILQLIHLQLSFFISVSSLTKQFYYAPGISGQNITFGRSDHPNTKVLHNFIDEVGTNKADIIALENAGFYSLKVMNVNGSFVDDVWMYHAIPAWLCKFTDVEYLFKPVPTEFVYNRTAVIPCTILGAPQPTFVWEKYNYERETWTSLSELGLMDSWRYVQSDVLGHLYIKSFNKQDAGRYRCRASNVCGARCPSEPRCSQEDVIGDPVDLRIRMNEPESDTLRHYFLNPIINHCWDTEGNYYEDGASSRFCSGLQTKANHIYSFSQYTSINSTTTMEAFFDYQRMQNDDGDYFRIGSVRWNEYPDIANFQVVEDYNSKSGICIAEIEGFKSSNMKEYYYCAAYYPNELLLQGLRFEFVMKEAPYISLPRGVPGKKMSRVIEAAYGSQQNMEFTIQVSNPGFTMNKVDRWICKFNGKSIANQTTKSHWHKRCDYNATRSDIVQVSIDYLVFGDAGYYQIIAGNDEGWAIGPPILLVVTGTEPDHGPYVLTELARTADKITVRWNRPNSLNKNPVYDVRCENRDWEEKPKRLQVPGVEWTELTNLKPGVLYAITVWLDNGLVADTKEIRTLSEKTEAIVAFRCTPGATYLECSWDEPDPSTLHSENIYYRVEIKDVKRKDKNTTEVRDKMEITLSNLRPYTTYRIKIIACNEKGCADVHTATPFQTEEELPGEVVFAEQPWPKDHSVHVAMKFPDILPGVLETEVVRYKEEHYNRLRTELGAKETSFIKNEVVVKGVVLLGNDTTSNDTTGSRHLFDTEVFDIEGLSSSTTYWMKFRWKTGAGPGPFTPYIRVRIGRYIDYNKIIIGCGVAAFFMIVLIGVCFYIKRRWPGLAKVVFQKIRDYINPSYMAPIVDPLQLQTEDDPNIVYEFDMTQNDI
ncbi:hypothetical protein ACHWQZ_G018980 [Mnemiopsis leidyi]